MNFIRNIVVHHTGGLGWDSLVSTQHLTAEQVDQAHKERWNFKSRLGRYGGYNVYIDKEGKVTQFREIGEETAAQLGHNFDSFSICLAGNFSINSFDTNAGIVDKPTDKQIATLKFILISVFENKLNMAGLKVAPDTVLDFSPHRIYPHRFFQGTSCYGMSLADDWAKKMV